VPQRHPSRVGRSLGSQSRLTFPPGPYGQQVVDRRSTDDHGHLTLVVDSMREIVGELVEG